MTRIRSGTTRRAAAAVSAAALSAAALLAPATGAAAATTPAAVPVAAPATAPVSGNEAIVPVGAAGPEPIVSPDGTRAYVTVTDTDGSAKLKAVDTRSDTVTGQATLGTGTWRPSLALTKDGTRLYALDAQTLSVIDTASLTVLASLALPDQPRPPGWTPGTGGGLVLGPDESTLYLVQSGPSAFRQRGNGRLLAFSTTRRAFTATVPMPTPGVGDPALRPGTADLYLGTGTGVLRLSTGGGTPTVVGSVQGVTAGGALVFTPDGRRLFSVNSTSAGAADLIDPATDTATAHLRLTPGYADLSDPRISADGTRLYLADNETSGASLLAFDTATGAALPTETTDVDEDEITGLALGPDDHTFYVAGTNSVATAGLQIIQH